MRIAKIIISIVLLIVTIIFLVLSTVFDNGMLESFFKISVALSITFSLTLNLIVNIRSIKNSFNTTNIYNSRNDNLDKAWQLCYKINSQIETVLGLLQQKNNYIGNKESDINDILCKIKESSIRTQELICIYRGSKEATLSENEKFTFISEYIKSVDAIAEFSPIIMINSVECNKKIDNFLNVLIAIKDKYNDYVSEKRRTELYVLSHLYPIFCW